MNNNLFELDMIIYNKKYSFIYSYTSILLLILIFSIYIVLSFDYHTYYKGKGIIAYNDDYLLKVCTDDINTILNNNKIEIENKMYSYQISYIDKDVYLDDNMNNYQIVYLKVDNINYLENTALEFKIAKKKQKIIYHILDYLERR